MHEPYLNREFTVEEVIEDNLRLRQNLNKLRKEHEHLKGRYERISKRLGEVSKDFFMMLNSGLVTIKIEKESK